MPCPPAWRRCKRCGMGCWRGSGPRRLWRRRSAGWAQAPVCPVDQVRTDSPSPRKGRGLGVRGGEQTLPGEAHPPGLGPPAAALAGRDLPPPDPAGGAPADPSHPSRPPPRREGRGGARLPAGPAPGAGSGTGFPSHRQVRGARRPGDRSDSSPSSGPARGRFTILFSATFLMGVGIAVSQPRLSHARFASGSPRESRSRPPSTATASSSARPCR